MLPAVRARTHPRLFLVATLLLGTSTAAAQADLSAPQVEASPPAAQPAAPQIAKTAAEAVSLATNAFEYRDFEQVLATLGPWLRPLRIKDPKLEIEARRLFGVSLSVLDRGAEAEAEFEALLKLAPDHRLDPFLVPPPVIQRFEAVRARLSPVAPAAPPGPPLPNRAALLLPFGTPQFVMDEPGEGALWGWAQALGLGLNIGAYYAGQRVDADSGAHTGWTVAQYIGLGAFVASWAMSSVSGFESWSERRRAQEPPAPLEPPPEPSGEAEPAREGPTAALSFRFSL